MVQRENNLPQLGVDVTDSVLRALYLEPRRFRQPRLTEYSVPLDSNVCVNGRIRDESSVRRAVQTMVHSLNIQPETELFITIPNTKAHVHVTTVDGPLRHGDVRVAERVNEMLPFSRQESYYDWQEMPSDEQQLSRVLSVAIARSVVDERIKLFRQFGKIGGVELRAFASARMSLPSLLKTYASIVLCMDEEETAIFFLRYGVPQSFFLSPVGTHVLLNTLMHAGGWNRREAEKLLQTFRFDPYTVDRSTYNILEPHVNVLVQDVRSVMDNVEHDSGTRVEAKDIFLCGPGSSLRGMASLLDMKLGRKVRAQEPRALYSYQATPDMAAATGLLLRDLDNTLYAAGI